MKCVECVDYVECSKKHNLTIKRKHCHVAKVEYVQTNADRIRAMSDEKFAEFIAGKIIEVEKIRNLNSGYITSDKDWELQYAILRETWLNYLREPVPVQEEL